MSRAKPRLPDGLGVIADEAGERLLARQSPPRIKIEKGKDGWRFSCPYAKEDEQRWFVLLADAFGTRNGGMIDHFLERITKLVPDGEWNDEKRFWYPSESDFNAVLAIVSSLKPENEAQAAHAAQLAALHLSAMKLGEYAARSGNERTVAVLAKTTRAYGDGMHRLAQLQGKIAPRMIHQTYEVHKHEHVHFEPGASPFGGQPYRADGSAAVPRPALPSPCPNGTALPMPSGEGEARVPAAWWGSRLWRSLRQTER